MRRIGDFMISARGQVRDRQVARISLAECRVGHHRKKHNLHLTAEKPPYHSNGHHFPSETSDRVYAMLADRYRGTDRARVIAIPGTNNRFDNSKTSSAHQAFFVALRVLRIVPISWLASR